MRGLSVLIVTVFCSSQGWSQNKTTAATPSRDVTSAVTRGQAISSAVSVVTSTAVSPLLGVCVLGSYEYFTAPKAERAKLPSYTSPWFWIPVGVLLILIFAKDTVGGFAPLIKKPLDAIEVLMLNKASLIFIGFPVVFHQVAKLAGLDSMSQLFAFLFNGMDPVVYAADASAGMFHNAAQISVTLLMLALGMIAMFSVWLVGHALDVLILLSPFPFLDLLLKGLKTALFVVLMGSSLINKTLGLGLALGVIVGSLILMGWAYRLAVFGAILAWDILAIMVFGLRSEPKPDEGVAGFSARRIRTLPKRTFGSVVQGANGKMEFQSRRMLVGATRRYPMDEPGSYEIGRGLFQPSLIRAKENKDEHEILFRLLPRYTGSEEQIRVALGASAVRDIRVPRGFKAFWKWLSDTAGEPAQETT
jgi:hypothetical protein